MRLLLVLIFSTACFGYIREVTGDSSPVPLFRTDNTAIQFLLNSGVVAGLQSSASGNNVTVISSGSDPVAAVRRALATWNNVTTANINFLPLQATSLGINSSDNTMVIAVGASASELSAVGSALALTIDTYSPAAQVINGVNEPKGAIFDSDIIINPAYNFSTDGSTPYDLTSVLTHELGHSLSANHTGLLGASMFQFNSGQRFLTADDLAFVNSAYPLSSGGAVFGTIGGTVTTTGGAPVPYALLTAFDTSAGVTVGSITNPDGTYSFQVPPGNYQMYAEPLNGVVAINIYLTSAQLGLAESIEFQTTMYTFSLNVAANNTVTANIAVTSGASGLAAPVVAVVPVVNSFVPTAVFGGPATVPSGQSVDLVLAGAGFTSTLSDSNFAFYGQGISLKPGSVRVDTSETFNGFNLLRVTLVVAATAKPSLASFVVTSGSNLLSFSGALVIVPPTPTFVSAGVISAAAYTGIQGGVSPGGIYSIYDIPNAPNLGPAVYVPNAKNYDAYGEIPAILAGVTVTFDGMPSPMFLSFANQLNFQVPFEVAGKTSTKVVVNYLGSASAPVAVPVLASEPSFFTSNGTAVSAYNLPSYTLNTAQTPAPPGSYVEVYGTGVGKVSYTVETGQGAPQFPKGFTGNYTYSIGGSAAAPAAFGGWTPGTVGLAQWDVQIPSGVPTGAVSIIVRDASGAASQSSATIFVQ
jgi:uncharacterized protein (TIGR03437 family)